MIVIPLAIKSVATTILSKVVGFAKSKLLGLTDSAKSNPLMYVVPICIVALMAFIIIPNMDNIKEKLGIDTVKSLSVKLNQEEHNTDTAVVANKKLVETSGIIKTLNDKEDDITEQLLDEIKIASTKVEVIKESSNAKVVKIVKDNKLTPEQKQKQISEVNISSIWDSYCSFNKDSECKQTA